jgi:hypothetical protein
MDSLRDPRRNRAILLAAAVLLLVLAGISSIDPHLLSLLTLRRVDDFPLYTMRYIGDYQFLESVGLEKVPGLSSLPGGEGRPFACTVIYGRSPQGKALMGRNFDWEHRSTMLLYTAPPDGYASVSMVDIAYLGFEQGISWEALKNLKQAPFWPFDGMNERGVAVGILAVPATPGLRDPARPTLDSLAVVRLILDYAGDLDEALTLIQSVNIDFGGGPWLHYLISDRNGSAVVEILSDRISIIRSQQPWQAATNFLLTGLSESEADTSCRRYRLASDSLAARQGVIEPYQTMNLLKDVSQESTVWSVVYNLDSGEILVALGRDTSAVHVFNLKKPLREIR